MKSDSQRIKMCCWIVSKDYRESHVYVSNHLVFAHASRSYYPWTNMDHRRKLLQLSEFSLHIGRHIIEILTFRSNHRLKGLSRESIFTGVIYHLMLRWWTMWESKQWRNISLVQPKWKIFTHQYRHHGTKLKSYRASSELYINRHLQTAHIALDQLG